MFDDREDGVVAVEVCGGYEGREGPEAVKDGCGHSSHPLGGLIFVVVVVLVAAARPFAHRPPRFFS